MQRKTPMVKKLGSVSCAMCVGVILLLTGCGTQRQSRQSFAFCCDNVVKKVPIITCQPLDVEDAEAGKPAVFYTEALGKDLTYRWFFIGGGVTEEPQPLNFPTAQQPRLEIPAVRPVDYGLYFCQVESTAPGGRITETRRASLGGPAIGRAGGTFAAVQSAVTSGNGNSVCGVNVGLKKVSFGNKTPNDPPVTPPENGWQGNLRKVVNGVTNIILRSDYVLQFNYSTSDKPCCTDVIGSTTEEVQCSLTPGRSYTVTAFFRPGVGPALGTQVIITGTWTQ